MKPTARVTWRSLPVAASVACAVGFFASVYPLGTSEPIRRAAVAVLPLLDGSVFSDLFRTDPTPLHGFMTRLVAPGIFTGLFLILALALGSALLRLIRFSPVSRAERAFFSLTLGTAVLTLLPPLAMLWGPLSWLFAALALAALVGEGLFCLRAIRAEKPLGIKGLPETKEKLGVFGGAAVALIVLLSLLLVTASGAPPFDYDTLEYHAEAAREIARTGSIGFFPRNAYMNMPLAGEMLLWWGNLSSGALGDLCAGERLLEGTCRGKMLLGAMALLAALGLYAFSRRFSGARRTGLTAALLFLAFPSVFENFSFGLVDGLLGLALLAAFYAAVIYFSDSSRHPAPVLLAGAFAGWAAAIKYTGVVFVLIPVASLLAAAMFFPKKIRRGRALLTLFAFGAAALLFGGYWYLKNAVVAGNPVWPLAVSLFGDGTGSWSAAIQERWHQAHSPHGFGFSALAASARALFIGEPSASAVLALLPLAPLSLTRRRGRGVDILLLGYALLFVLLWFFFTHRLTRFLVPILPIVSLIIARASANLAETAARLRRAAVGTLILLCALYALAVNAVMAVMTSDLFVSPQQLARDPLRSGEWSAWLADRGGQFPDADRAAGNRLLLLGDARAFAYRVPIDYSTCWNRSPLAEVLPESAARRLRGLGGPGNFSLTGREAAALRDRLAERGIGFVLYDQREIERFLSPGNYGLTDGELLSPALIAAMEKARIISRVTPSAEETERSFPAGALDKVRLYRVEKSGAPKNPSQN
ncbi:MAG: DUF2029 domain-containing protein [Thermoguttaceae bacterium]|nr:DUF2029 domain-containing protein [Thermoguttaceae bacterium]